MKPIEKGEMSASSTTYGTWIQIASPTVVEVLAAEGFDWIAFDMEHGEITVDHLPALFRPLERSQVKALVRVRQNALLDIRQALDLGASGVIVPLVDTAEEAERAVRSALYPPEGVRGFAFCRCNGYGKDFGDYVARANDEVTVMTMVESREAIENIDAILATDHLSGVFIGPYDLSGSYGVPGDLANPLMTAAFDRTLEAANAAGKLVGLHVVTPEKELIRRAVSQGFNFIALGVDDIFLRLKSRESLSIAKSLLGFNTA